MSNIEIAAVTVGSVLVYMVGCGVWYGIGRQKKWDFDDPGPMLGMVVWPLSLPALLSAMITERLLRPRTTLPKAQVHK